MKQQQKNEGNFFRGMMQPVAMVSSFQRLKGASYLWGNQNDLAPGHTFDPFLSHTWFQHLLTSTPTTAPTTAQRPPTPPFQWKIPPAASL